MRDTRLVSVLTQKIIATLPLCTTPEQVVSLLDIALPLGVAVLIQRGQHSDTSTLLFWLTAGTLPMSVEVRLTLDSLTEAVEAVTRQLGWTEE